MSALAGKPQPCAADLPPCPLARLLLPRPAELTACSLAAIPPVTLFRVAEGLGPAMPQQPAGREIGAGATSLTPGIVSRGGR